MLTNNGTSPTGLFNTSIGLYGPAFFTWPSAQAVATRQDYSYAVKSATFSGLTTVAAQPGDVIILWGTGFGPTTPAAPPGVPVPSDKIYSTSTAPTVTINNVTATVYGAALAPGYAGLYQVAIQVPTSLADGDWPIIASIGGVQSPSGVILSVHHQASPPRKRTETTAAALPGDELDIGGGRLVGAHREFAGLLQKAFVS